MNEDYLILRKRQKVSRRRLYAVVVPKKVAVLATARNRIRRRVSEAIRNILRTHHLSSDTSFTVTVRQTTLPAGLELSRDLLALLHKSGIVTR